MPIVNSNIYILINKYSEHKKKCVARI